MSGEFKLRERGEGRPGKEGVAPRRNRRRGRGAGRWGERRAGNDWGGGGGEKDRPVIIWGGGGRRDGKEGWRSS